MLALIVLGTGALFSMIFHVGTKEQAASGAESRLIARSPSQEALPRPVFQWNHWLKEPSFYQVTPKPELGHFLLIQRVSPPVSHRE